MNVPFFIAKKYFFSQKKRSFINFISIISMIAISLGTMALIIVLSVFNGLEDLNRQIFKVFDPDLKISSKVSKSFLADSSLIQQINNIEGVKSITEVYQDKALARSNDAQMIVVIKGVSENFEQNNDLRKSVVEGEMKLYNGNRPQAFIGAGAYNTLGLTIENYLNPLILLYPKNQKINVLNPEDNINQIALEISGVFVLEQQYDNYIYLPLETVEELTGNDGKRTAIEIQTENENSAEKIKNQVSELLSENLVIKNRDEQNAALFKAIKIEKLFIFIALFFIIGIASFNIFYALTMLVIDKKDDIQTLSSFGLSKNNISKVFIFEGFIISGIGVSIGLVLGLGFCLAQIHFGFIKLGMEYAMIDTYPVKIIESDVIFSVLGIFFITFLTALLPAQKAKNFMLNLS
jgi:lipoprotein-releasing system permease protein